MASSVDYLDFDSLLTEEQRLVRDTVGSWVDDKVLPIIEEAAWEGRFPKELVPEMAQMHLFGSTIAEYGLPGLDNISYGLIMQELERGDSGLRSFVSVQSGLVMYPIYAFGSKEQKDKWIPKLASAEALGCFGLTEPDFGSNPAGMRTTAKKDGDSYVLNGAKAWITSGSIADVAVVWAKLDGVVRGFLVERGTKGFSTFEHKGKMSLRASVTSQLAFEDCRIPAENILPGVEGLKGPLSCLTQARYGIAWGALGSAMATYYAALEYSKSRKQWRERPIAAHQLVQERLAWMITEITKGQLLAWKLGPDEGRQDHEAAPRLHGQAQQRLGRARVRQARPRDPRRQRRRQRVSRVPAPRQHRERLHLRGDPRHPHAHHRRGRDRNRVVQPSHGVNRP